MKTWRLIPLEVHNAYMNMAIDEAILQARINGKVPNTVRFYRWKPSAVSVGRFQKVEKEVHVNNCRLYGVDIVRRITGGGTVYHDSEDEITYSIVVDKETFGTNDVSRVYRKICNGLIEASKILGINADFSPGNLRQCPNITINGKKISGSAQAHRAGVVLQHGTLLLDVNLRKMFTFLKVPWTNDPNQIVCVAQRKITSLAVELGRRPSVREAYSALRAGFERALGVRLVENGLTRFEIELASKLSKDKFSSERWIFEGVV